MLNEWAERWGIPASAMRELIEETAVPSATRTTRSEAAVQTDVRLAASRRGWRLWRNNVGAFEHAGTLQWVRFGLCNESAGQNRLMKSSDLIGIRPRLITPADVGTTIGQFCAVEVKHGTWVPGRSKREQAQAAYIALVRSLGGCAGFSTGELPE